MLSWMSSRRGVGSLAFSLLSFIACAGSALAQAQGGGPAGPCENFNGSQSLPAGWSATRTGVGAASGWAVVNTSSNSAPNAVFANDPNNISSQFLTLPSVLAGGNVTLDFWARVELEDTFDGLVVEASINGGAFANIGDPAFTLNGYSDTISVNFSSEIAGQRAFSGVLPWAQHIAVIPASAGDTVVIRFRVATDSSVAAIGAWLDDICVNSSSAPTECCWTNGTFDDRNGQASHLGGSIPNGTKAADDFYLCEGFIHDLSTIRATLLTTTTQSPNNTFVKPKAEIWSDCNGCPDRLLYTFDKPLVVETGATFGVAFDGRPLRVIDVTFDVSRETVIGNQNVVLKGGTYWLSIYGQTDGLGPTMQMYDVTYWGSTARVKGKAAYKIDGTPSSTYNQFTFPSGCGPAAWHSVVDDCCIGCNDLNFTLCAPSCKILVDNGGARRQTSTEVVGSTSQFAVGSFSAAETRTADDFVVPPCQDYRICYIEGCVLTNCPTFDGAFEVYSNDCNKPSYALHGSALHTGIATKIIDLGYSAILDGRSVRAYKLEFHDLNFVLSGGRQYWLSVGVKYTFSIVERAYFCYNADCNRSCLIRWNNAKVLTATSIEAGTVNTLGWADTGNDASFLIAANGLSSAGPIDATPGCRADFNLDGALNTQDVFDYLSSWFVGCN